MDTATALFYRDGINATGIDRVIADAGVAKASLYNNFTGKGDLVAAYLDASLARFVQLLDALADVADPVERLDAFFAEIERAASANEFSGCPFSNAAVEVAPDSPAHAIVLRFYAHLARFFAETLGVRSEDETVKQLIVCYDGAMSAAKILRDPSLVGAAGALARSIACRR